MDLTASLSPGKQRDNILIDMLMVPKQHLMNAVRKKSSYIPPLRFKKEGCEAYIPAVSWATMCDLIGLVKTGFKQDLYLESR